SRGCDLKCRTATPAATTSAGRRHAAPVAWGQALVPFGRPWIDDATIIEGVHNPSGGGSQRHAAVIAECGTSEPLVRRRTPLVTRGRDLVITHHCIDLMIVSQRAIERDAGSQRQERLIPRVGMNRRRLKADACSPGAEGEIARVVEF